MSIHLLSKDIYDARIYEDSLRSSVEALTFLLRNVTERIIGAIPRVRTRILCAMVEDSETSFS